ncbi:MAG: signal peptidase II [Dialister sp.]|nr:signal peptidase II [Dialister sp.]
MITIATAVFICLLDQAVKWLVQTSMVLGESVPIFPHIFHLTYIINPGAAFGILADQQWFFLGIVGVLLVVFFMLRSRIPSRPVYFPVAVGMLLGGALGNAIDRVRIQGVVDFFDFRIWPIFNVADVAICLGVGLIAFYYWRRDT